MAKLIYKELHNGRLKDLFEEVRSDLIKKVRDAVFLNDKKKVLMESSLRETKLFESSSKSKVIGSMYWKQRRMELTQRGVNLKDDILKDIIGHEFMHLLINCYLNRRVHHDRNFRNMCHAFGLGHVSGATIDLKFENYREDVLPQFIQDEFDRREKEKDGSLASLIGSHGLIGGNPKQTNGVYKYAVRCTKCNRLHKRKVKSNIIKNPNKYKCCCGGVLISETL